MLRAVTKFPNHPDLLILRDKLETFITKEQEHAAERPLLLIQKLTYGDLRKQIPQLSGAARTGTLINSASFKVMPASWLDLQLSYLTTSDKSSRTQAQTGINFTNLRDAAHLCLHATFH